MKTAILYHSHSGITKGVIEKIQEQISADIIEVKPEELYSALMVVPKGCYRAMKRMKDSVLPKTIDLSGYDMILIASPVWAGKPTPVINGAMGIMTGTEGKKGFVLLTCGSVKSGNDALSPAIEELKAKGVTVAGTAVLDKTTVTDSAAISQIVREIKAAGEQG